MLRSFLAAVIGAFPCLLSGTIAFAQGSSLSSDGLHAPPLRSGPEFPGGPVRPGRPTGPSFPPTLTLPELTSVRKLKPTWLLQYNADRIPVPGVPTSRMICRLDRVREIVAASDPVAVGTTPPPPQFPDIDGARMWTSREALAFVSKSEIVGALRLQYVRLHQMRCAAPAATSRLKILSAYVAADNPPFDRFRGDARSENGMVGYSWFGPFTVLTDGVSVQGKRLRQANEGTCDATPEMLDVIQAKRKEQESCMSSRLNGAIDSPNGLAAYGQCENPFVRSLSGCVFADGAGSGCQDDPERVNLPYLLSPKNQEWRRSGEEKLQAIAETLTGVSVLTTALDAAEIRYASSDAVAQAAIAESARNLQAAFKLERSLLDTEKARLNHERMDVDLLAAEIVRQRQAATQYTRDKTQAEMTVRDLLFEQQAAETRLSERQTGARMALVKAENAFIDDQSKGQNCLGSGSDCTIAIEADFNRSNASVDAFRNGQIALRELDAARLSMVRFTTTLMAERLAQMKASTQLAQTQTMLAFDNDQYAKRTERLQQDQRHLDKAVADSRQDRLRFDAAVGAYAGLTAAPSQSCSGP